MRFGLASFLAVSAVVGSAARADDGYRDLHVGGAPWLRTYISPFDDSTRKTTEQTYKVHTQIFDFNGDDFLTKGAGGKYTHHRGLFIGWMQTEFAGGTYDTWHMRGCYQQFVAWSAFEEGAEQSTQTARVEWRTLEGKAFLSEDRTIAAARASGGLRVFDFTSVLDAVNGPVRFRGDLQHAGMQVRLSNEVSTHEETTEYILPEAAEVREDDEVIGAWWALCSAEIGGKRWWIMHMTPPDHPTGVPVYSIRAYARFGAFFEPDIAPGAPQTFRFRVVVSPEPLDRAAARALYDAYAAE